MWSNPAVPEREPHHRQATRSDSRTRSGRVFSRSTHTPGAVTATVSPRCRGMTVVPPVATAELPAHKLATATVIFTILSLFLWPFCIGGVICAAIVLGDKTTRDNGMVLCLVLSIIGAILGVFLLGI